MPELPEVETIRIGLSRLLPGLKVNREAHNWDKSFPNSASDVKKFLIGAKVKNIERRGKALVVNLSTKYSLAVHLKMTGQLVFASKKVHFGAGHPSDSLTGQLPDKSTRVTIEFTDGSKLFFNDQRKFGWMRLLPTLEIPEIDFFKKLGPDPLKSSFTPAEFKERLKKRPNTSIKAALMDQTVIAGVGNIYADEALWGAKIHPATLTKNVPQSKLVLLLESLREVLKLSIKRGGSTDRNYVDAEGKKGSYLNFAKVFRRQGKPCPRCGTEIQKIRIAGRGTHICPYCQRVKLS